MPAFLCIHGHFYQPPREDPWLGEILSEASAAPMRHWNERILRESYAPLAWARRLGPGGKIADILNCYEWISFNSGPTLMQWLRSNSPETLQRMREADALSLARWGHGNALAQIYHHVIMPLASEQEKKLEIRWAIDDFRYHFNREPEGMWLSECAVDLATLDALAAQNIRFVILAPRQAKAVIEDGRETPVDEGSLNIGEPYIVNLPSGATMTVIFYHGGLSQGIAFEALLRDGEQFWRRITETADNLDTHGLNRPLLTLATDGETYGHHFTFGEMALAHVLSQAYSGRNEIYLTNPGAYLASNPPKRTIILHEPSSWSCVHGVERWRSNCGCTDGGHPGWNQQWRPPLREALEYMREKVAGHFALAGTSVFKEPEKALLEFGKVLADPNFSEEFAAEHCTSDDHDKAWRLLSMQEQSLAALASCAWFFDDIARIEPENAMTFALRAMELMQQTGGEDLTQPFLSILEKAHSNKPEAGSGKEVFVNRVLPRVDDAATLCLSSWLLLNARDERPAPQEKVEYTWPYVSVELTAEDASGLRGSMLVTHRYQKTGTRYSFTISSSSLGTSQMSDNSPLSFADLMAEVTDDRGATVSKHIRDCSAPLLRYLFSLLEEYHEVRKRPKTCAEVALALTLLCDAEALEYDIPRPELWSSNAAYIVPVYMALPDDDARLLLARKLFERFRNSDVETLGGVLASDLILKVLLEEYDSGTISDETLARNVSRARELVPGIDWWQVQNLLWEKGIERFPALARELGFL